MKRFIQIYTGNGKGKTTAAIGLTIRALGNNLRVLFLQFMKDHPYSELDVLKTLPNLTLHHFGDDAFVFAKTPPSEGDKNAIREGLNLASEALHSGDYDLIILDEICVCPYFQLFDESNLIPLLEKRPENVELVLTGRYCPESWKKYADLITEMTEAKHYYQQGVLSRPGFDC